MPVILLIVSTLVFWVLFWFVRMGGIEHFRMQSAQRKEETRRQAAREAARAAPLRAVDDPRDAAAILMLLVACRHGDPTREQIAAIENYLREVFGFDQELTERITHARFMTRHAGSFEQAAAVFADLFKQRLSLDERLQLIDMLDGVARANGPSEIVLGTVEAFKRQIGLAPAR